MKRKLVMLICLLLIPVLMCSCNIQKDYYKQSTDFFEDNKESLAIIASFISQYDTYSIEINDSSGSILVFEKIDGETYLENREEKILDNDVLKAIECVFDDGCELIYSCNEMVEFRLSSWFDFNSGIVYSSDIDKTKRADSITEFTSIYDNVWFYYYTDYS